MALSLNNSVQKCSLQKNDLRKKQASGSLDSNEHVEEIRKCEKEIRTLDDQERQDKLVVFRNYMNLLKPLFDARSKIIESIPKFWVTVIEYHPKLSCLISEEVCEVLQHVYKLEVVNIDASEFKITLALKENPYIENKVLIKEFSGYNDSEIESVSTPIKWKRNPFVEDNEEGEGCSNGRKRKGRRNGFFAWFCNDRVTEDKEIVNSFDEIWQNPMPFFLLGVMDKEVGECDLSGFDLDVDINVNKDNVEEFESRSDIDEDSLSEDEGYEGEEEESETEEGDEDMED